MQKMISHSKMTSMKKKIHADLGCRNLIKFVTIFSLDAAQIQMPHMPEYHGCSIL